MKILIIGGTGHVGTFLCDILKSNSHEVVVVSRGNRVLPEGIKAIYCDANDIESLKAHRNENFDAVIDFPGTAKNAYEAFAGYTGHVIGCGSLWMLGRPKIVPTPEAMQSECPFADYAKRFSEINQMIEDKRCSFTAIMPPNICGPGKIPLDGLGGRDINVHKAHMHGEKVYLPEGGECLIAPCDAYDIARLFALCTESHEKAANQIFNVGPAYSLSTTQFIKTYAYIYGVEIPIEYVSWDKYKNEISPSIGHWWHFYSHMCPDISKAEKLLGYRPKFTSEESMERATNWMKLNELL